MQKTKNKKMKQWHQLHRQQQQSAAQAAREASTTKYENEISQIFLLTGNQIERFTKFFTLCLGSRAACAARHSGSYCLII